MGIVARQSTYNLIIIILGFALGGLSKFYLMPKLLTEDQLGKLDLLLYYGILFSIFLNLGSSNTIVKFYKEFELKSKSQVLIRRLLVLPAIASVLFGIILLIWPQVLSALVAPSSAEFIENSIYVIVMVIIAQTMFISLTGVSNSYLKTVLPVFLTEVVVRALLLGSVLLYFFSIVEFDTTVLFYGLAYVIIALILYLSLKANINLKKAGSRIEKDEAKQVYNFGIYSLLESGSGKLVNVLDVLMIGKFLPAKYVSFYTISLALSAVIKMSSRALAPISLPLLASAWTENNLKEIKMLYQKTSLSQMILGGMSFVLIWASIDELELELPEQFRHIKYVVFWLCFGNWINISSGINGMIIMTSDKYKFNFYLNLVLIIVAFIFNTILIPQEGIVGAAKATCFSLIIFNFIKFIYVYVKWGMQPFTWRHIVSAAVILGFLFAADQLDAFSENSRLSMVLTTITFGASMLLLLLISNIAPDFNSNLKRLLRIK